MRISLAGGGTDLPSYADRFGGAVVGTAMNQRVCVVRYPRSFGGGLRTAFQEVETVAEAAGLRDDYVRACLRRAGIDAGVQLGCFSDAPAGVGLGGSGAFTVALTSALRYPEEPGPAFVAEQASAVEMVDLGRVVGKQDHYLAAFGGMCLLSVGRDRSVEVERLRPHPAVESYVDERLLLFLLGSTRDADRALSAQAQSARRGDPEILRVLHGIKELVAPAVAAIRDGRTDEIGPILDAHWTLKSRLSSSVADEGIRRAYEVARESGADGGKLLGAGGGGFLLLSCAAGRQGELRGAMAGHGLRELPFTYEPFGMHIELVRTAPRGPLP
jgi:D-glycero-alpha-D-manno-heptose-7-phosphate kinase